MVKEFALPVLGKKIAFSTVVQLAGRVVLIFISAVSLKLISNYLGQAGYGVYATIAEYSLFFSVAANLGIFGNTVRMMADSPTSGRIFANTMFLRVLTAGIFLVIAVGYAWLSGGDNVFVVGTLLYGCALFLDYVTAVCDGMLQANYMMGRATFALVAGKLLNLLLIFAITGGFLSGLQVGAAVIFVAVLVGALCTAGLSLYFVLRVIDMSFELDGKLVMDIFWLSLPFGIINILNNLYFRFLPDYFARGAMTDSEFASFNVSYRIAQTLSLFSTFLMFSVLPGFRQYLDNKDWAKAEMLFGRTKAIVAGAGMLLVFGGTLMGPWAIMLLTSKDFISGDLWFMLPMMLILAAVSYGYDMVLIILFSLNRERWFLKMEIVALSIALAIFGISSIIDLHSVQVLLILTGAICAESFMVIAGYQKILKIKPF